MPTTTPPKVKPYRLDRSGKFLLLTGSIVATSPLVISRAEITAATTFDLTDQMVELRGFTVGRDKTAVPAWGSTGFPQSISGPRTVEPTGITTKADLAGVDINSITAVDANVVFAIFPGGDVPTQYGSLWRAIVSTIAVSKMASDFNRVMVDFDIVDANERFVIPA